MKNYFNYDSLVFFVIFFSILKFIYAIFYGDAVFDMEWSNLYYNLKNNGIYSIHEIDGKKIPSVYMPPLYPYFLYCFSFLNLSDYFTVKLIIFIQCVLSGISTIILYKILKKIFNKDLSFPISLGFYFYPLNFYSASQISSITLQIFLFIFFLYFFTKKFLNNECIILGILSGLLVLIRGEFWLLLLILFTFKLATDYKNFKKIIISIILCFVVVSPQIFVNYKIFSKIVITNSSGFNLWRGNSAIPNINGATIETLDTEVINIKKDIKDLKLKLRENNQIIKYEIYLDDLFKERAVSNILENPKTYFIHYIKKFIAFSVFNFESTYPNYWNPLVFIPEIIVSIFALLGLFLNFFSNKKNFEMMIIIFYYLTLIPIFFVLPRYKLFILPIYFIYIGYFISFLIKKNFFKETVKQCKQIFRP
tara:strand:- start:201 stop:1463 length:1263 start_codon:yes stop_codon:yes gene_type:complete